MSDLPVDLDPEVTAILQEIAELRAPGFFEPGAAAPAIGLLDDLPSASAGTARWKPAVEHLVKAHREQVGHLLRAAVRVQLERDPASHRLLVFFGPNRPRPSMIETTAERLAPQLGPSTDAEVHGSLVELARGSWSRLDPVVLARAAVQAEDNDIGRILLAISHIHAGEHNVARTILQRAASRPLRAGLEEYAWANLGLACTFLGRSDDALRAHSASARIAPACPVAGHNWLVTAVDQGDERSAISAIEHLGDVVGFRATHVSVLQALRMNAYRRGWDGDPALRQIVRSHRGSLSGRAKFFLDAVL